jgi:hypothetical protein
MSFELTRKHLKADLAKRALINDSDDEDDKKNTKNTKNGQKIVKKKSLQGKSISSTSRGAAAPPSKLREHNPFIRVVDESGGSIKQLKKQIKSARDYIDDTAAESFFIGTEDKIAGKSQPRKFKRPNTDVKISSKAMINLSIINRTAVTKTKAQNKAHSYASRIRHDAKVNKRSR